MLVPAALVLVAAGAVALVLFQPWKLIIDMRVDEPAPQAALAQPSPSGTRTPEPAGPETVARGQFISHEHGTSGRALVLALPDGQRVLRLEDFDTSNGPDLKVWLSEAPVLEGTDGWFVFDDHPYVSLGALKGNVGNQNHEIPASADLDRLDAVSIWCERFHVSFGAAELKPV